MSAGQTNSLARDLGQDPPASVPTPPESYLFNRETLTLYGQAIANGLALMLKKISAVNKPHSGASPHDVAARFSDIDLDTTTVDIPQALEELENLYLDDAVYFHHPRYVAHLNCPIAVSAILGELILSSVNSSLDTWDQSGGGTYIEQTLIDWTTRKLGLGEDADGVFTSGGTQSNLMGMLLARDVQCLSRYPNHSTKRDGLHNHHRRLRILTSEASHFSIKKAAAILGLGHNAVLTVPTNCDHRMDMAALEHRIDACHAAGLEPIAVVATAGTTDFGSIDPLARIATLCQRHQLWFHVDAAYGCGLLVSPQHREQLNGIEHADSVTVDYHKSFFQPVSCGAFLVKRRHHLDCVTHHADHLNPLEQRQNGTSNLVDKSLQTTKRFDALKLWLTLRTMGPRRIGQAYDELIELAKKTHHIMAQEDDLELLNHPELTTLVFRYRPKSLPNSVDVDHVNRGIRRALFRSGEAIITDTRLAGHHCLKLTLLNPATSVKDIRAVINLIKAHGAQAVVDLAQNTRPSQHRETSDD